MPDEVIQRYTFGYVDLVAEEGEQELQMIPCKFGEAVKIADHLAAMSRVEAERDAFKAKNKRLRARGMKEVANV